MKGSQGSVKGQRGCGGGGGEGSAWGGWGLGQGFSARGLQDAERGLLLVGMRAGWRPDVLAAEAVGGKALGWAGGQQACTTLRESRAREEMEGRAEEEGGGRARSKPWSRPAAPHTLLGRHQPPCPSL